MIQGNIIIVLRHGFVILVDTQGFHCIVFIIFHEKNSPSYLHCSPHYYVILIPWRWLFKLFVPHFVMKFTAFCANLSFSAVFWRAPTGSFSEPDKPISHLTCYFFKIHINTVFHPCLGLRCGLLPSHFLTKFSKWFLSHSCVLHVPSLCCSFM